MAVNVDTIAMPLLEELLECLCTQLALTTRGPVCACCITTGPPVIECCTCEAGEGMAWVRVVRIYPSLPRFPAQAVEVQKCPVTGLAVELELGAARCSRQVTEDGSTAECPEQLADAEAVLDDAAAMRRALSCCFAGDKVLVINQWQSYGPEGGCVGGYMAVTVQAYDGYPATLPPVP